MADTDKGINGYLPTYRYIVKEIPPASFICELGVLDGGSLELWQRMFPYAQVIVGVDVNPHATWPDGTVQVVLDQASTSLPDVLREISPAYDLIVDDASHDGRLTRSSFDNLWPLVAPGGFYVIEDWGVGFPRFVGFDDSMLRFAQSLLGRLEDPHSDVVSITYSNGLITVRKML
jgi:hypothetical protein